MIDRIIRISIINILSFVFVQIGDSDNKGRIKNKESRMTFVHDCEGAYPVFICMM
jgi:hypothetical protein